MLPFQSIGQSKGIVTDTNLTSPLPPPPPTSFYFLLLNSSLSDLFPTHYRFRSHSVHHITWSCSLPLELLVRQPSSASHKRSVKTLSLWRIREINHERRPDGLTSNLTAQVNRSIETYPRCSSAVYGACKAIYGRKFRLCYRPCSKLLCDARNLSAVTQ